MSKQKISEIDKSHKQAIIAWIYMICCAIINLMIIGILFAIKLERMAGNGSTWGIFTLDGMDTIILFLPFFELVAASLFSWNTRHNLVISITIYLAIGFMFFLLGNNLRWEYHDKVYFYIGIGLMSVCWMIGASKILDLVTYVRERKITIADL